MHKSVATIDSPEFINLQPLDINPLMSKCEIKVLYVGENRNGTFIPKETAMEMAKTLRGAPIVGYWREDKEDFADHGEKVTIDDEGFHFECLTKPYGFVAPDAEVWFQKFNDENDFGEIIEREYLMTTGYLWTGQFEECKTAVEGEGKPHSMELDSETLKGHWDTNSKGMDFFIINDATFSKLCILGEDVEPCFEGSKISAPEVSTSFTFKQTLFTMMQELRTALEGGNQMNTEEQVQAPIEEPAAAEPQGNEEPAVEFTASEPVAAEEPAQQENPDIEPAPQAEPESQFTVLQDQYNALQAQYDALVASSEELKSNYAALETQFNELQQSHSQLVEFKRTVEDAEKDKLIEQFYMLSDEDKQDVRNHKSEYSLEEIEAKLSVICVRKKVNFDLEDNEKNHNNTEDIATTFNLNDVSSVPAWIQAVRNTTMRS